MKIIERMDCRRSTKQILRVLTVLSTYAHTCQCNEKRGLKAIDKLLKGEVKRLVVSSDKLFVEIAQEVTQLVTEKKSELTLGWGFHQLS